MDKLGKGNELEIRVSQEENAAGRRGTERSWQELLDRLDGEELDRFAIAELADLLARLEPSELTRCLVISPSASASSVVRNYLAAMVEQVCADRGVPAPPWTRSIPPLERPWFGSELQSLRLHLLRSSPAPFRHRNLFIDTSMGGRV